MSEVKVAQIIVDSLFQAGVRTVFGIPGAKIDTVFNVLRDHPEIQLIVCRHEQNAAMMAAATGRITGVPGVCIATSGPGASNLVTGLLTANTEGDPVVAIVGSVPRLMNIHRTHQSMKALDVLGPASKSAVTIEVEDQAAEVVLGAFRTASHFPRGVSVINLPIDVAGSTSKVTAFPSHAFSSPAYGLGAPSQLERVVAMVQKAKFPVLFLGLRSSTPRIVEALHDLLHRVPLPTVETFQAAGAVSKDLVSLFYGRVGLFRNQVGDKLLQHSDLVLCVGYDPVEYDPSAWNPNRNLNIVHIDYEPCDYGVHYHPTAEVLGSIRENIVYLANQLDGQVPAVNNTEFCHGLQQELRAWHDNPHASLQPGRVHPLYFVSCLQARLSTDTTVTVDVGTVYIYMMRYFYAYNARKLLCSDGQQTLGVGLPWAIAASLAQEPRCSAKVVSMSGDGGFMFSSQELSTAVQQGCNITHFIWNDASFNMVEFQEEMKYGRSSGVALGGVDFAKFADAFGAKGFAVRDANDLEKVMDEALAHQGVSIVDVAIDYSEVQGLASHLLKDEWN